MVKTPSQLNDATCSLSVLNASKGFLRCRVGLEVGVAVAALQVKRGMISEFSEVMPGSVRHAAC